MRKRPPTQLQMKGVGGWLIDGERRSRLGPPYRLEINGEIMTFYFWLTKPEDIEAIQLRDTLMLTKMGEARWTKPIDAIGHDMVLPGDTMSVVQRVGIVGEGKR